MHQLGGFHPLAGVNRYRGMEFISSSDEKRETGGIVAELPGAVGFNESWHVPHRDDAGGRPDLDAVHAEAGRASSAGLGVGEHVGERSVSVVL